MVIGINLRPAPSSGESQLGHSDKSTGNLAMKQAIEGEKRWWVSIVSLDSDTKDSPGVFIIIIIIILTIVFTIIIFSDTRHHPFKPIYFRLFRCEFSQQFLFLRSQVNAYSDLVMTNTFLRLVPIVGTIFYYPNIIQQ